MADTNKRGFRYPQEEWDQAQAKLADMRAAGYDIDMTKVLAGEVDRLRNESTARTAERLGLVRAAAPVPVYRSPFPRSVAEAADR